MGCGDDDDPFVDVDGQAPTLSLTAEHVQTEIGREFLIRGSVEDKDGLSAIRLQNTALNLDKTIDLIALYPEELLYAYELNYKFKTPKDQTGERFELLVTVTDVGGRTVQGTVLVTMDGDFTDPIFQTAPDAAVTVLIKEETKLNLSFTVVDDKALDYVDITIPQIGFSRHIAAAGTTVDFKESILLPSGLGVYHLTITAIDKFAHAVVKESVITVSEMPDFEKMYLADVSTTEALNSDVFGVPMRIERTAPYRYKANYYCQQAGTEIFFLPQKSDFTPICFGLDPEDNTKLADDPDIAQPIVLTQANVYYEITFDVQAGTYAIDTYSIAEAIDPIPHAFGSISLDTWADGGTWLQEFYFGMASGPGDVQRFTQDAVNPHLFYLEHIALEAGEQMNFIIHNWHSNGWWNYCTWRVDNSEEPEVFNYYGNFKNPAWTGPTGDDNWTKPTVKQTGVYTLRFDAHLGRGKLVRE
jgi:hypothetical protein